MQRILFVFLDGVGLAPPGPTNPLASHSGDAFRHLGGGQLWTSELSERETDRHLVRHLDATLGVAGLPQSGTGQATLLTGRNCARLVGRHFGPFPHSSTYEVLDQHNLFHQIQRLYSSGASPTAFANAFPPQFFDVPRRRQTVTTRCCTAANVPLRDLKALRAGQAVAADFTADSWRERLHLDVNRRSVSEAATHLATVHCSHAFTLFEYFLTDKVGHRRIERSPHTLLEELDQFFGHLLDLLNPQEDTLLITSDHGNLEDMSHTLHTRHAVPLIVYGWAAPYFQNATNLTDVTPGLTQALVSTQPSQR